MTAPFSPNGAVIEEVEWPAPDFGILNLYRRLPPQFPLAVLGTGFSAPST
jgi:hypothetical protein